MFAVLNNRRINAEIKFLHAVTPTKQTMHLSRALRKTLGMVSVIHEQMTWNPVLLLCIHSMEICDEKNNITMCPMCDRVCGYWKLTTACGTARASHLFDNAATVFFSIFMALWGLQLFISRLFSCAMLTLYTNCCVVYILRADLISVVLWAQSHCFSSVAPDQHPSVFNPCWDAELFQSRLFELKHKICLHWFDLWSLQALNWKQTPREKTTLKPQSHLFIDFYIWQLLFHIYRNKYTLKTRNVWPVSLLTHNACIHTYSWWVMRGL